MGGSWLRSSGNKFIHPATAFSPLQQLGTTSSNFSDTRRWAREDPLHHQTLQISSTRLRHGPHLDCQPWQLNMIEWRSHESAWFGTGSFGGGKSKLCQAIPSGAKLCQSVLSGENRYQAASSCFKMLQSIFKRWCGVEVCLRMLKAGPAAELMR
jgi:hypothetical protein